MRSARSPLRNTKLGIVPNKAMQMDKAKLSRLLLMQKPIDLAAERDR